MANLADEQFVSITTFRKDGSAVGAPVWAVGAAGQLYIWTGEDTWKVKRIRNNPAVTIAPCTRFGKVTGPAVAGRAAIVEVQARPEIWPLFVRKYGLGLRVMLTVEHILTLLRVGPFHKQGRRIYLEVTL
jgi:PPOX class probable F420-dependent enzyme